MNPQDRVSRQGAVSATLASTLRQLVQLKPGSGEHVPAFRSALGLAVPLAVLLGINRIDLALYATLGGFAAIYGRNLPTRLRLRQQTQLGLVLLGCMAAASVAAHLTVTTPRWLTVAVHVLLPALLAAASAVFVQRRGIRPLGGLFPVFCAGAVLSIGAVHPVWLVVAVAAATQGWALLLSWVWQWLGERNDDRDPQPTLSTSAELRGVFTLYLLAAALGGAVGVASGLPSPYWAQIAAVVPLAAQGGTAQLHRGVHRIVGTLTGLLVTAFLLSYSSQAWQVLVWVVIFQFFTELFVVRNYAMALTFLTPLALLMVQLIKPRPVLPLLEARLFETVIGVLAGLAVALAAVAIKRRYAAPAADPS